MIAPFKPRPNCERNQDSGLKCGQRSKFRGFDTYGHLGKEASKNTCDIMRGEIMVFPFDVLAILRTKSAEALVQGRTLGAEDKAAQRMIESE